MAFSSSSLSTRAGKKKAKHDVEVLEEAVEAVRSKRMGLRKAAKVYQIAVSTLADKVKGKTSIKRVPRTLLTAEEEVKLFKWTLQMSEVGFGQSTDDIRVKVQAILELRGDARKDGSSTTPSAAWVYRFFERHPQLSLRTPMSLGKERALVSPTNVQKWFEGLHAHIAQTDPSLLTDPTRIFNADESGFSFDPRNRRVIAWKGVKNVYNVTSNTKTQVTVLAAMNAAGFYVPPLLIYPYKRVPGKDLMNGFPDAVLQVSDNGWITSAIFFAWLRDTFIPKTSHLKKPLLLLVDGHISHTSLYETSEICEKNGIILYCLLAHASHILQPLDQAFFGSVKSAWSAASRQHIAETGDAVGLDTFAKVFQQVWEKCSTQENAESSYRAAGIFPFCPQRALGSKKMGPCCLFRDVPPSGNVSSDQPPTEPTDDEPEPPAPFEYTESDDEPEPPAPFEYTGSDDEPEPPAPFEFLASTPVSSQPPIIAIQPPTPVSSQPPIIAIQPPTPVSIQPPIFAIQPSTPVSIQPPIIAIQPPTPVSSQPPIIAIQPPTPVSSQPPIIAIQPPTPVSIQPPIFAIQHHIYIKPAPYHCKSAPYTCINLKPA